MTDPRTVARELGPEKMEALARRLWSELDYGPTSPDYLDFLAAARRLAAPEPVTPKWPEKVWAVFRKTDGIFITVGETEGSAQGWCKDRPNDFPLPARLVPADAVVLTLEEAKDVQRVLGLKHNWYHRDLDEAINRAEQGGRDA